MKHCLLLKSGGSIFVVLWYHKLPQTTTEKSHKLPQTTTKLPQTTTNYHRISKIFWSYWNLKKYYWKWWKKWFKGEIKWFAHEIRLNECQKVVIFSCDFSRLTSQNLNFGRFRPIWAWLYKSALPRVSYCNALICS